MLCLCSVFSEAAFAQQHRNRDDLARPTVGELFAWAPPHSHARVDVPSAPIVSRYRIPLNRPRRIAVAADGTLFVADQGAGTIVRVDPEGQPELLADGLAEPAGLVLDPTGSLYVVTHAGGMTRQGQLLRIEADGGQTVVASGLTGATDVAQDGNGDLYVAAFDENRVLRVTADGAVSTLIDEAPAPTAVAIDPGGSLFVACSGNGTILRLGPGEAVPVIHTRGLVVPSDLVFDSRGHLIVTSYGETGLLWIDARGTATPFATVPKGTIGIAFDPEGNLLFVNWDEHYLTRVVTHLTVPCPHCNQPIPLRLIPRRRPVPAVQPADEPVL